MYTSAVIYTPQIVLEIEQINHFWHVQAFCMAVMHASTVQCTCTCRPCRCIVFYVHTCTVQPVKAQSTVIQQTLCYSLQSYRISLSVLTAIFHMNLG